MIFLKTEIVSNFDTSGCRPEKDKGVPCRCIPTYCLKGANDLHTLLSPYIALQVCQCLVLLYRVQLTILQTRATTMISKVNTVIQRYLSFSFLTYHFSWPMSCCDPLVRRCRQSTKDCQKFVLFNNTFFYFRFNH